MSSSFTVYNLSGNVPSYRCVKELFYSLLTAFLSENGITEELKPSFELASSNGRFTPVETEEFIWSEHLQQTLWVGFEGIADTFYISVFENEQLDWEIWEEISTKESFPKSKIDTVRACLSNRFYWDIERTAGCGKVSALIYGFMAASLAKLTNGIVYSCDYWPPGDYSNGCDYAEFMHIYLKNIKSHISTLKDELGNS